MIFLIYQHNKLLHVLPASYGLYFSGLFEARILRPSFTRPPIVPRIASGPEGDADDSRNESNRNVIEVSNIV